MGVKIFQTSDVKIGKKKCLPLLYGRWNIPPFLHMFKVMISPHPRALP
jgi:hypothetical protein